MKTNRSRKTFKLSTLAYLTLGIGLAQPLFGFDQHQLVFTEDLTGLSVTDNGTALTVTDLGGTMGTQHWAVALPTGTVITSGSISWIEPENPNLYNNVAFGSNPTPLGVASDVALPFATIVADETTVQNIGTINGVPITATFDDDAATAEVPDTASTFGLLALALAALFGVSRFRVALRLA